MGRIWALAGGLILGLLIILILGPLGGLELQLTSALCVGTGAAAAYLGSPSHMLARGLWLLVGVLLGALGFALASAWAALDGERGLSVPRAHDYLPVAGLLPAGKAAFRVAMDRAELGFRTFKWKVGVADPRDERGMLDDLLSALPSESRLRLDANGA